MSDLLDVGVKEGRDRPGGGRREKVTSHIITTSNSGEGKLDEAVRKKQIKTMISIYSIPPAG